MKVVGDREVCVGTGMCFVTAPNVFDQDNGGLVVVLAEDVPAAEADAARRAVSLCPSGALRILAD
jgi:ferredoxin